MFRRYEDEYFWWEIVILGRKLTYSICGTLMVVGPDTECSEHQRVRVCEGVCVWGGVVKVGVRVPS